MVHWTPASGQVIHSNLESPEQCAVSLFSLPVAPQPVHLRDDPSSEDADARGLDDSSPRGPEGDEHGTAGDGVPREQ
jgi:hypothetical protein